VGTAHRHPARPHAHSYLSASIGVWPTSANRDSIRGRFLDHSVQLGLTRRADRKVAPETLVATDGNKGVDRSRPMCVYPNWPRYSGSGDVNIASSFICSAK
jgi:hypothetical protein